MTKNRLYTVQDVSAKYSISKHTIRYYTDLGLIPSIQRDEHNNRLFSSESLNWLEGCICLRGCGMSIKDLKHYGQLCLEGDDTLQERYLMVKKCRDKAEEKLKKAQAMLAYAEKKVKHYEEIIGGRTEDNSNPAKWKKSELSCRNQNTSDSESDNPA